jgi:photosystem II stability/assembly factor-like uncharacterized protein
MVSIPTTEGRAQTISDINVNSITMDPQDSLALYLASFDRGLFYTYNIANGWNKVAGLPETTVNAVQVDPKNKCLIYAAAANRLYRSNDCTRTWSRDGLYVDNDPSVSVNTIAIDHYNTSNIYIGTSRGEIIKSIDGGGSWRTIQKLEEGVTHLIISPLDSRLIFVATASNHIFSFSSNTDTNPGNSADVERNFLVENWTDLDDVLSDYDLGSNFKDLIIGARDGYMFLATSKLILRSPDNGITWENLKLITPEKDSIINAIAVNPQDSKEICYVTNTNFFRSIDGGATWSTKNLPTKRAGRELLIDFANPNILYLGTVKLK